MGTAIAVILVGGYLAAMVIWQGSKKAGYRALRDTISELGEQGDPGGPWVSWGVFFPVAIVLAGSAGLAPGEPAEARILALALAVGYATAAVFPCEPGSPLVGGWRQSLHNLGGAVQYGAGGYALLRLGLDRGQPYTLMAITVGVGLVGLSAPELKSVRGLLQRLAEVSLFAGLALAWLSTAWG